MTNWHDTWQQLWLDWGPSRLRAPLIDHHAADPCEPLSAQEAWSRVRPEVEKFDPSAKLRSVQSEGLVHADGRAHGWVFAVDAITRRAQGVFKWRLMDQEGRSELVRELSPFPAIGSPLQRIVAGGYGPAKLLDAAWDKMREDAIDLSPDFMDSTLLASSLAIEGVEPSEMFLQPSHETFCWKARAHDKEVALQL